MNIVVDATCDVCPERIYFADAHTMHTVTIGLSDKCCYRSISIGAVTRILSRYILETFQLFSESLIRIISYSLINFVVARNCCMTRMLPGDAELVSEWIGLPGEEKCNRFERSNGLDLAAVSIIYMLSLKWVRAHPSREKHDRAWK